MDDMIDQLLETACRKKASDLHITAGSPPILRINGTMQPEGQIPLTKEETEAMAKKITGDTGWKQFISKGELDIAYRIENVSRFRVNVYRQRQQVGIVFRVIPSKIPSLDQLNMPLVLQEIAEKPQGLFLVTGPTGSGKSTTLAAMIDYVNKHASKHIITLEDPIEYEHLHHRSIVNQRQVGVDTDGFASGLRAALRQDPDVILVGEMRDHETISTAITAAETGHLVLATLHTSSAVQTINRIIDVFPPYQQGQIRTQLSMVLAGILSQRLIKTMDGKSRVAATEVLINMPSIANLIRNEKVEQIDNVLQTSRAEGMHTLEASLHALTTSGRIHPEHAAGFATGIGGF
ncbi:type IV pilus twitching motility protein PilT [Oceanobacillus locisalsi]|uniref:Type IV pilus twitching motility protein PilT n=1 Tax=Oceanobacillus locisalsi TaxID=546107 RepID=A0ABW3NFW4_9BACI